MDWVDVHANKNDKFIRIKMKRTEKSGWKAIVWKGAHIHANTHTKSWVLCEKKNIEKLCSFTNWIRSIDMLTFFSEGGRVSFIASLFITLCVGDRYRSHDFFPIRNHCELNSKSNDFRVGKFELYTNNRYTTQPLIFNSLINFCSYLCFCCYWCCLVTLNKYFYNVSTSVVGIGETSTLSPYTRIVFQDVYPE